MSAAAGRSSHSTGPRQHHDAVPSDPHEACSAETLSKVLAAIEQLVDLGFDIALVDLAP